MANEMFVVGVRQLNLAQTKAMLDEIQRGHIEFELKIKTNSKSLGSILAALPPKVSPQIERMVDRNAVAPEVKKQWRPSQGGPYRPGPGTSPAAVTEFLRKNGPARPSEIAKGLASQFVENAVSTAIYNLAHRGWIKRRDGKYELDASVAAVPQKKAKPKPAAKKKKPPPKKEPKTIPPFLPARETKANGATAS